MSGARRTGDDTSSTKGLRTPSAPEGEASPAARAEALLKLAERRSRALADALAGDCAWNMLLHLVVAKAAGRSTTVSDACAASLLSHSTAHRYLLLLERSDIVARSTDPADRRRQLVALTMAGDELMAGLLAA